VTRSIDCDRAEITFSIRNEVGLIDEELHTVFPKLTGSSHDSQSNMKTNRAYFEVSDKDYAQRSPLH
jgi:hypothetical protein